MPPIGQLARRVQLQSPTDSTDSYGQPTRTWATYATVWAQILPASADESQIANQQGVTITHKVAIRYRADVTVEDRILYKSRFLNIKGLRNQEEKGVLLELDAEETA